MGEWNATCMMTNLPIEIGERCTAVLLVWNNFRIRPGRAPVHAEDYFFPWSPLIIGTYDGTGGLDRIEGEEVLSGILHRSVSNIQDISERPYQFTTLSDLISDAAHGNIIFQHIQCPGSSVVAYPVSVVYFKEDAVHYAQKIGRPCFEYSDEVRIELLDRLRKNGLMDSIKTTDTLSDFKFAFSSQGLLPILFQTVFYDRDAMLEPLAKLKAALDELRLTWTPTQAGNPDSYTKVLLDFAELTYKLAANGYAKLNA